MADSQLQSALAHWAPRLIANGIPLTDFQDVTGALASWNDWCTAWVARGDVHDALGEADLAAGHRLSAGEHFSRAAVCHHFAKFVFVDDLEQMKWAHMKAVASRAKALPLIDPPGERVEIPYMGTTLKGELRKPAGSVRPPVLVMCMGLDSTKEEMDDYENRFLARGVATLPWGLDLPLHPFFGVMGVAPPPAWGRISSIQPRAHGGNLDNKELGPGSSLYLPVHVPGALFSCGDGHGAQGDGEVCVTAIETALLGTFELVLHRRGDGQPLAYPRGETATHWITMGMDPDLDRCMEMALRDMIVLLGEKAGLSREDAYTLCSLAVDFRITQTVNGHKGVHGLLRKAWIGG
jgi:hypothetical protein